MFCFVLNGRCTIKQQLYNMNIRLNNRIAHIIFIYIYRALYGNPYLCVISLSNLCVQMKSDRFMVNFSKFTKFKDSKFALNCIVTDTNKGQRVHNERAISQYYKTILAQDQNHRLFIAFWDVTSCKMFS